MDVALPSSGLFRFELPAGHEAAVYVSSGAVQVGGVRTQASAGDIVILRGPGMEARGEEGQGKGQG